MRRKSGGHTGLIIEVEPGVAAMFDWSKGDENEKERSCMFFAYVHACEEIVRDGRGQKTRDKRQADFVNKQTWHKQDSLISN